MELRKCVLVFILLVAHLQAFTQGDTIYIDGLLASYGEGLYYTIPTHNYDSIPTYRESMTKSEQKALKAQVIDDWGAPTFTHETRVLVHAGPSVSISWKRYDSERWEEAYIFPTFTIKSKWQFNILYDWVMRVAETHFEDRYYIVRDDHDVIDACWAAAEHFERFAKLIGIQLSIDYMEMADSKSRTSVVRSKGKSMTKPSKFSQIQTGKKRL